MDLHRKPRVVARGRCGHGCAQGRGFVEGNGDGGGVENVVARYIPTGKAEEGGFAGGLDFAGATGNEGQPHVPSRPPLL